MPSRTAIDSASRERAEDVHEQARPDAAGLGKERQRVEEAVGDRRIQDDDAETGAQEREPQELKAAARQRRGRRTPGRHQREHGKEAVLHEKHPHRVEMEVDGEHERDRVLDGSPLRSGADDRAEPMHGEDRHQRHAGVATRHPAPVRVERKRRQHERGGERCAWTGPPPRVAPHGEDGQRAENRRWKSHRKFGRAEDPHRERREQRVGDVIGERGDVNRRLPERHAAV